jgi:hypothetical protein
MPLGIRGLLYTIADAVEDDDNFSSASFSGLYFDERTDTVPGLWAPFERV